MEIWKRILVSAASIVGISIASDSASAAYVPRAATEAALKKEAEQACQDALAKDDIDALEEFLRKYGEVDTACTAKALEGLANFGQKGGGGDGPGHGGGGYNQ